MAGCEPEMQGGPWTRAKNRIQDFVAEWAEKSGVDPKKLLFKWDVRNEMNLHNIRVNERVCFLTIYLGERSQSVMFPGSSLSRSNDHPEEFLSENKDQILAALEGLKGEEKQSPRAGPLEDETVT